jgi:endonuclease YncB( thermonuclease family)
MNLSRFLIFLVLLGTSGWVQGAATQPLRPGSGQAFTAKVIAVLDGDTVLILRSNGVVKVRLVEIDAPEKLQTFGESSRRSLSDMVMGRQVQVVSQAIDQYGRMVAHLSVAGQDVNAEQIRRGMAWEYSNFHSNKILKALEAEARQAPRGLWALSDPAPPWEWRKQHPNPAYVTPAKVIHHPAKATAPGCGDKTQCPEMSSCDEARYYLTQCGVRTLDQDGDGTPCEQLCAKKVGQAHR